MFSPITVVSVIGLYVLSRIGRGLVHVPQSTLTIVTLPREGSGAWGPGYARELFIIGKTIIYSLKVDGHLYSSTELCAR
jgi:hypothetical protein